MRKRVLVIGAGPGGSAAAALIQRKGHSVTLLEKNNFIGGKCWSYEKSGYLVDSGVHMFSLGPSGPHGEAAKMLNAGLEWIVRDPDETGIYGKNAKVYLPQKLNSFRAVGAFANIYSKNIARPKLLNHLRLALNDSGIAGLAKTLKRIFMQNECAFMEFDEMSVKSFLLKITDCEGIVALLEALCMLCLVLPYDEASAGEFLYCLSGIGRSSSRGIPRGGSMEIPASFLRAFRNAGGVVKTGSEVGRIIVENNSVKGVEIGDGEFLEADVVVSSAGIKRTVEMAGASNFPEMYVERVNGLRESFSFITLKYGLSKRVIDLKAPSVFNVPAMNPERMFDYLKGARVPDDLFLFMPVPTEWDSGLAPTGKQLVIAGIPGPREVTDENMRLCEEIHEKAESIVFSLFPDIPKHIEWHQRTNIQNTSAITGKPTGECIGIAQCPGQTGLKKPSVETPVSNLLLVGSDAGARGVGTEMAVASAIRVSSLF